jgi:hypothetical protein
MGLIPTKFIKLVLLSLLFSADFASDLIVANIIFGSSSAGKVS